MAFSESLVTQVRELITQKPDILEKKMFGCVAFLVGGSMAVGVHETQLIVRLPLDEVPAALKQPGVRVFDLSGRPMKGWVLVGGPAIATSKGLATWVARGLACGAAQPKTSRQRRKGPNNSSKPTPLRGST